EGVDVAVRYGLAPPPPCLGDEVDLALLELGERPHVPRRVDDDLLPLERAVQVRDDPHRPRGTFGKAQRLRRRAVLAARAERAVLELLRGWRRDRAPSRSRSPAAGGG